MSVAAINWAKKQRGMGCSAKCVLLLIADEADSSGRAFVGARYIAANTEQSEDTVRRRLKDLEEAGYLVRLERHTKDGRQTTNEIRLALGEAGTARDEILGVAEAVDVPENDAAVPSGSAESPAPAAEGTPADCGGAPPQPEGGHPRTAAGPMSPADISRSPSQPFPVPGKGGEPPAVSGSQRMADLFACYPEPTTKPGEVERLINALSAVEFARLLVAAKGYRAYLEKRPKRGRLDAVRFVRDPALWDQFAPYAPAERAASQFVARSSEGGRAWAVLLLIAHDAGGLGAVKWALAGQARRMEREDGYGWMVPSEFPPGGAGLAAFAGPGDPVDCRGWHFIAEGSANWWAWDKRARRFWSGGKGLEAALVPTGDMEEIRVRGERREVPVRRRGLRLPSPWPPALGTGEGGDHSREAAE